MAAIGHFETTGPAQPARYRSAVLLDFVCALLLAMLAYPFPIMRATLPLPVFVMTILASIVVVHVLYEAVVVTIWGRSPAMYLLDLGVEGGRPGVGAAMAWGAGVALAFWPTVFKSRLGDPENGLAARLSGLVVRSSAVMDSDGESE